MNKAVKPETPVGKVSLIQWLKKNDPDFLDVAEKAAVIFGPLEFVSYKAHDEKVQADLYKYLKDEYLRHKE